MDGAANLLNTNSQHGQCEQGTTTKVMN